MDRGTDENNKRRGFPDLQDDIQEPKRACHSITTSFAAQYVIVAEIVSSEKMGLLEDFIRSVVREEVENTVESQLRLFLPSSSIQLNDYQTKDEVGSGSETLKFKLRFLNQITSPIFTNNEIEAENGYSLQLALCDATNNAIVPTGPLSSARIEFVVLDGEFCSDQPQDETYWTATSFNESILSQRGGRNPLIAGNDLKLYMKNGVAIVKDLSFTDNSSWLKSKKFRLGARVIDEKILSQFPRIGEAVSEPFRVKHHRGEVKKKHHPPKEEDEVWRLEGIGKDGVYHSRLSAEAINTVADFLKTYYEKGALYLRKLLGKKVSNKTWKAMLGNALECQDLVGQEAMGGEGFQENLAVKEAMGGEGFKEKLEVGEQKNSSDEDEFPETLLTFHQESDFVRDPLEEASTLYEMTNGDTLNQYYQQPWTELAPKPK